MVFMILYTHAISQLNTIFSEGFSLAKKILTPKIFERVFTIPIDPDDFEIDIDKTQQNVSGMTELHNLITLGKVVEVSNNNIVSFETSLDSKLKYKLLERNKTDGNLIFEKYWFNIETVEGTVI